jgi:hypothetical protein
MVASVSGGGSSLLSSLDFFFVILLRFDLRREATPCGGGPRLVGMVAGLMRLVFAMPTKAISQRSFMWYFKSDYTRLNNYMHLLWVAAQAKRDYGYRCVSCATHIKQLKSPTLNN